MQKISHYSGALKFFYFYLFNIFFILFVYYKIIIDYNYYAKKRNSYPKRGLSMEYTSGRNQQLLKYLKAIWHVSWDGHVHIAPVICRLVFRLVFAHQVLKPKTVLPDCEKVLSIVLWLILSSQRRLAHWTRNVLFSICIFFFSHFLRETFSTRAAVTNPCSIIG